MKMKTIWKFPIEITDVQPVCMPEGAEILSAQVQGGQLCLWALVNPENQMTERVIEVFGTGNPIHSGMGTDRKFIATAQMRDMPPVWHVFERL